MFGYTAEEAVGQSVDIIVPEAQRFLVHRTGSQHRHRRIFEFAADLDSLLSRIQPHVVVGFLIVLAFGVMIFFVLRPRSKSQP